MAAQKFISWSIVHHFKKTSSGRQSHTDIVTNVVILFYDSGRKLAHMSWIMVIACVRDYGPRCSNSQ